MQSIVKTTVFLILIGTGYARNNEQFDPIKNVSVNDYIILDIGLILNLGPKFIMSQNTDVT